MRKTLPLMLLSTLLFGIVTTGAVISTRRMYSASESPLQLPKVLIEPQNGTASPFSFYTIAVKIIDVTDLYAFDIQIRWGTSILQHFSHIPMAGKVGGVLTPPETNVFTVKDNVNETDYMFGSAPGTTYWYAATTKGAVAPFTGNGTFFTMTFFVLQEGECDIYFTSIDLSDKDGQPISYEAEDAYFYRPGLGEVPVANFTFSPDPAIANKTTTFDASSSHNATGGSVALFMWDFGDGTKETTASPTVGHAFSTIPLSKKWTVGLTVLDNSGSQSKYKYADVDIVHPRPVAVFTVWPEDRIAVVDQEVRFDASESYDPDAGGNIVEYRWDFGDAEENTTYPMINHTFHVTNPGGYTVQLIVVDDSDGLESNPMMRQVIVVQSRDIEVAGVTVSPSDVRRGEELTMNATLANRGEADESFSINAYYNSTMTDWIKVAEKAVSSFSKPFIPEMEFANTSIGGTVYQALKDVNFAGSPSRDNTRIVVGTETGYWTVNPGTLNTNSSSPSLVSGTPLTTGGWIWTVGDPPTSARKLNGEFAAGVWAFKLNLTATQPGVSATVYVRFLKSDNPDPQAGTCSLIQSWTSLFTATELPTAGGEIFDGNVSIPASTVFTDEYLFLELQLRVTANTAVDSGTQVVFRIGGDVDKSSLITAATFIYRNTYTLSWRTESTTLLGAHIIKLNTTQVPHETNLTNNIGYSNAFQVSALSTEIQPLDVSLDVGTIHFRGEIAEFYVLVTNPLAYGRRVDASLNASIIFGRGVTQLNSSLIERVGTGIYYIRHQINANASPGTYALVVDASKLIPEVGLNQTGSALKSFLVSPKLSNWDALFAGWDATLTAVEDDIGTIITSVGEIRANLTAINATFSGLITGAKGEILAEIDTALGQVVTSLGTINGTVTTIKGDTASLNTTLGDIDTSIGGLQSTITLGLAVASALSAVAMVVAVLVLLRVRKLGK